MVCKFCFAELDEDVTVCPLCGKELKETEEIPTEETVEIPEEETEEIPTEETEEVLEEETEETCEEIVAEKKKKKMPKPLAVTLAVLGSVILAGALTVAVLYGMGIKPSSLLVTLGLKEADIDYKSTYIVSDAKAQKKAKEVIATVGDQTLTNEQLQIYYWLTVQNSTLEFDTEKPLSEQIYNEETGTTLEQHFLEMAIKVWRGNATFVQMAKEDNYELTEDVKKYLDNFKASMDEDAKGLNYADAEAYLDEICSKSSSVDAYCDYVRSVFTAEGYKESGKIDMTVTEQEMEEFYTAHEADFKTAGVDKSAGKYYSIRHALIAIEGEMGEGGYTDAQWEACRAKAQKLLDDFLANEPTEEKFGQLAMQHSVDTGSAANGGMYSCTKDGAIIDGMVYPLVNTFMDWYLEEGRKPGDTGLVKNMGSSKMGYHIMYFCDSVDIWKSQAEQVLRLEKEADILAEAESKYPMTVDYKKIVLGQAELGGAAEQ